MRKGDQFSQYFFFKLIEEKSDVHESKTKTKVIIFCHRKETMLKWNTKMHVYTQIACYFFYLVTLLVFDALNNSVYNIF